MYYRVATRVDVASIWQWKSTVLSSLDTLFHAIRTAARGEVVMQPETMARILSHTASVPDSASSSSSASAFGSFELTRREQEVLARVAQGERSKEILHFPQHYLNSIAFQLFD